MINIDRFPIWLIWIVACLSIALIVHTLRTGRPTGGGSRRRDRLSGPPGLELLPSALDFAVGAVAATAISFPFASYVSIAPMARPGTDLSGLTRAMPNCEPCQALGPAALSFNDPSRMAYREDTPIELVLAPKSSGIDPARLMSSDLQGEIVTEETVYALKMQATLSGPSFSITPAGPQLHTVLPDRETKWSWTVKPLEFGQGKVLTLVVEAIPVAGDAASPRDLPPLVLETYKASIVVDVGLWDLLVHRAGEVTIVQGALGFTAIGILSAFVWWLWSRLRERREKRAAEERKVGFELKKAKK